MGPPICGMPKGWDIPCNAYAYVCSPRHIRFSAMSKEFFADNVRQCRNLIKGALVVDRALKTPGPTNVHLLIESLMTLCWCYV